MMKETHLDCGNHLKATNFRSKCLLNWNQGQLGQSWLLRRRNNCQSPSQGSQFSFVKTDWIPGNYLFDAIKFQIYFPLSVRRVAWFALPADHEYLGPKQVGHKIPVVKSSTNAIIPNLYVQDPRPFF